MFLSLLGSLRRAATTPPATLDPHAYEPFPDPLKRIIVHFWHINVLGLTYTEVNGCTFIWRSYKIVCFQYNVGHFAFRFQECDVEFDIVESTLKIREQDERYWYKLILKSVYYHQQPPPTKRCIGYKALVPLFSLADEILVTDLATLKNKEYAGVRLDMMYLLTRTKNGTPSKYGYYQNIVEYPNKLKLLHAAIRKHGLNIDRKNYLAKDQQGRIDHLRATIKTLQNTSFESYESHLTGLSQKRDARDYHAMEPLYDASMALRGPRRTKLGS